VPDFILRQFYEVTTDGRVLLHAMPLLLGALCVLALAYRYYSAFLAAKVAALDDARRTPAHVVNDGKDYHPTNKWVLFGHHFAAISGAGPLIGPVLAIQYGYMPGLLWLVIGVCLAGAVQDMLVLAASVRRGGRSLAEIARAELGPWAYRVTSAAILFIVVIALAGLGIVVVKALGGEEVALGKDMRITLPEGEQPLPGVARDGKSVYRFPERCRIKYSSQSPEEERPEGFDLAPPGDAGIPDAQALAAAAAVGPANTYSAAAVCVAAASDPRSTFLPPAGSVQLVKGSSWGTFTIACTIPIALFVGLYMYRIRKGRVLEASLIGAALVLGVTVAGALVPGSPLEGFFSLTKGQTTFALCAYGFVASVLPVWMLLCPRDYLSSFLKIGTVILLIAGVFVANPVLHSPALNPVFQNGGPTFQGGLFPFVFICIMCGAVSGFHALVSSGTTPKMIDKEKQVRTIGYGAMLMEGVVGLVALIAAASLDPKLYYDINTPLDKAAKYQPQLDQMYKELGNADVSHLDVVEKQVGNEALRGRTGGAVTLAVGMSQILSTPLDRLGLRFDWMKYWYHFAIMFEALFILTTIDTGTRIARFLLQEVMGNLHPQFGRTDWLPGSVFATAVVTAGWGVLVGTQSVSTIWPMFGIANQLLAVVALAVTTTLLVNTGRAKYAWVTLAPMLFVLSTTMTAAVQMCGGMFPQMIAGGQAVTGLLSLAMTVFVVTCVGALLLLAAARWVMVLRGVVPVRPDAPTPALAADGVALGRFGDGAAAAVGSDGIQPGGPDAVRPAGGS
jgi:carbon starvation protein